MLSPGEPVGWVAELPRAPAGLARVDQQLVLVLTHERGDVVWVSEHVDAFQATADDNAHVLSLSREGISSRPLRR